MGYFWGVLLGLGVGAFASLSGFDRSRSFYPTVLIVVGSYYGLFAVMGDSLGSLWGEIAAFVLFAIIAIKGFRSNPWLIVIGLVGHGTFDLVHHQIIANAGIPPWWPSFCMAIDWTMAAYLAVLLRRRERRG